MNGLCQIIFFPAIMRIHWWHVGWRSFNFIIDWLIHCFTTTKNINKKIKAYHHWSSTPLGWMGSLWPLHTESCHRKAHSLLCGRYFHGIPSYCYLVTVSNPNREPWHLHYYWLKLFQQIKSGRLIGWKLAGVTANQHFVWIWSRTLPSHKTQSGVAVSYGGA